ncbi:MAG: c-type cytochrome, partial [Pirellulaceae bacterium]|nr:c-type cytochrome [Pirellulaceae bacterium]
EDLSAATATMLVSELHSQTRRLSGQRMALAAVDFSSGRPAASDPTWRALDRPERSIRYAARSGLERQPLDSWRERAYVEKRTWAKLESHLALARHIAGAEQAQLLDSLDSLQWSDLTLDQQQALLRIYGALIERHGTPPPKWAIRLADKLSGCYPNSDDHLNRELATLLYSLHARREIPKLHLRTIDILARCSTLMQQIHYIRLIAVAGVDQLTEHEQQRMRDSLDLYELRAIATRRYATQSQEFQALMRDLRIPLPESTDAAERPVVRTWATADLQSLLEPTALDGADLDNGKKVFRAARCANCHRLGSTGGVLGPQLNGLSGRYTRQVVLESIVEPDKVVSDQFRQTSFRLTNGKTVTGQIVNLNRGAYSVQVDPFRPFGRTDIKETDIEEIAPAKTSLMPSGLLNTFSHSEIRDLVAFLLATTSRIE